MSRLLDSDSDSDYNPQYADSVCPQATKRKHDEDADDSLAERASELPRKGKKAKTTANPATAPTALRNSGRSAQPSLPPAPAPAPVGSQDDACPIDWNLPALRSLLPYQREIYEMRSPWKPKSDFSLSKAAEILNNKYQSGKCLTDESWRKRFSAVQIAVYKATGLYWAREYKSGLKKLFGPPSSTPTPTANTSQRLTNSVVERKIYDGNIFTVYLKTPGQSDDAPVELRFVPLAAAVQAVPSFAARVKQNNCEGILEVVPRTADLLFACYMAPPSQASPNTRPAAAVVETPMVLPSTGYCLNLDEEAATFLYEKFDTEVATEDLFALYLFASEIQNSHICNLVKDHWRDLLKQELAQKQKYKDPSRWFELPSHLPVSIMDFDPENINELWCKAVLKDDNAVRELWLDMLAVRYRAALPMITSELWSYSGAFLNDWVRTLEPDHAFQVWSMLQGYQKASKVEIEEGRMLQIEMMSTEPTLLKRKAPWATAATWVSSWATTSIWSSRASWALKDAWTQTKLEGVMQIQTIGFSKAIEYRFHDMESGITAVLNEGLNRHRLEDKSGPTDLALENEVDLMADITRLVDAALEPFYSFMEDGYRSGKFHPALIVSCPRDCFCDRFHKHAGQKSACYLRGKTVSQAMTSKKRRGSSVVVTMTINGIKGYRIHNHSGLPAHIFRTLPSVNPHWDWPRIRSVTWHRQYTRFDERPVYFDVGKNGQRSEHMAKMCQDENGRWPSHPGWRNPGWTAGDACDNVEDETHGDGQSNAAYGQARKHNTAGDSDEDVDAETQDGQSETEDSDSD